MLNDGALGPPKLLVAEDFPQNPLVCRSQLLLLI
jgi:hypothetical protein